MQPLVSIIIPCYNNEKFVDCAIQSVINQTYSHTQIIVIDDGSTDDSLSRIRQYSDQIQWMTGPNQGAPVARNLGLELAQGEYVKFLDADDLLLVDCLQRQIQQSKALPADRKTVVYGDAVWVNQAGEQLPGYQHKPRNLNEDPIAHILAQSPLTSCPLHRREYLLEIKGFDPSILKGQEHDLHLRLVLAGVEFVYHPGPVYRYREYSSTNRISSSVHDQKRASAYLDMLQRQQALIVSKTGKSLSPAVRQILAQRFWAYGRSVTRVGLPTEAEIFFSAAQALEAKDYIAGSSVYQWLVKFSNPQFAESILHLFKSLHTSTFSTNNQ